MEKVTKAEYLKRRQVAPLDAVMLAMPKENRYVWCEPTAACACLGCANFGIKQAGYTKQDWEMWVKANPSAA